MSGYKALLLVLDLRKKEEDSALEMWTDAKNAVINFERQIEQLKQFEKIYENEMTVKSKNGMDMNMYMSYQQFLSKPLHPLGNKSHHIHNQHTRTYFQFGYQYRYLYVPYSRQRQPIRKDLLYHS